jgi:hypothetical protein
VNENLIKAKDDLRHNSEDDMHLIYLSRNKELISDKLEAKLDQFGVLR